MRQLYRLDYFGCEPSSLRLWDFSGAKAVFNVELNGHVGKKRVVLKNCVDISVEWRQLGDIRAFEENPAAGSSFKARD